MTDTSLAYNTDTAAGQYFATHQKAGDAWAQMHAVLDTYGLSSLGDFLQNGIIQGWDYNQAYEHLRATPEYQQRFAANIQRQKEGLPPISETDYVNTERQYGQVMAAAGLPQGFYDSPDDFTNLLARDVPATELQSRITDGYLAAQNADPETKAALASMGITDGHLAAYYLDPTKTLDVLQRQTTQAQIMGAAARTGFGNIGQSVASDLQKLGVTKDQAAQGFNDLSAHSQLMNALPGQDENNIDQATQLSAEFGQNAQAQQLIKQRGLQRAAATQGGGSYLNDKNGFGGIGANQ